MSLIMEQIKSEHPELFALEFGKMAESHFVYTLASANIDQSVQTWPQYIYTHKVLDEFDYGTNQIRTSGVICP